MRYTIEGFSQTEAVKFRRTEIVNGKERVVALDCTDLVILRWFVDFWPNMMKVEVDGQQYAWLSYKAAIEDMPLLGIKKGMFALRLKKLVDFGILSHKTIRNGGTFSYYGFGQEYKRLVDSSHAQAVGDHEQNIEEGMPNKLKTPQQNVVDQIDPSTKDSSTRKTNNRRKPFVPPTIEEIQAHIEAKGYHFDARQFFDYYEASDWHFKDGKPVRNWKQCCVTWEGNHHSTTREQGRGRNDAYNF